MSKRTREANAERPPYSPRTGGGGDMAKALVPIGLGILLVLSGWSIAEVRGVRKDLTEKVAQLDGKIAELQKKVESGARAAQPQKGPDPAKAYTIKTEGAPYHGNSSAPITIAEFSDFQ